jgi:hypothetical protein
MNSTGHIELSTTPVDRGGFHTVVSPLYKVIIGIDDRLPNIVS